SDNDRGALDLEFGALMSEIDRIAKNTTWNTMSILNGANDATPVYTKDALSTTTNIQLGAAASQTMTLTLKSWVPSVTNDAEALNANGNVAADGTGAAANGQDNYAANKTSAFGDAVLTWGASSTSINISKAANATFAITQLDKAIQGASAERANFGAFMARLTHSADNLTNVAQNTDQSRSRIEDADYAVETSELARTQIISQAATAMLAQANQSKQGVLSLLQ
ncbi:flagellin, partial [Gammaproteobacteria bacterium]|nr:flagellin [Gammaproteobacteria bacterium]